MRLRRPGVVVVLALVAALSSCAQASTEETSTAASPTGSPSSTPEQSTPSTPAETVPPRDTSGLTPELSAAAEAFVAFAADERPSPPVPWAEEVRLVSGRELLATLVDDAAGRRESWLVCPQVARDSGYTCPVSPLRSLAGLAADDQVTTGTDVPDVIGCQRVRRPRGVTGLRSVTLMPPGGGTSCFDAFLVSLHLDDEGRVATVDWQLSGP